MKRLPIILALTLTLPTSGMAGETTVTRARIIQNETIGRAGCETVEFLTAIEIEIWGKRG